MSKVFSTIQITEKHASLVQEVKDHETALKALRKEKGFGENWENHIEKDTRPAVKTLYTILKEARERLNKFIITVWVEEE